ncbi:alpha/beta fold hydrolase [Proteinivorax hydrogeniformans]|uniref:Alpha/beta fold hydrolase n=1 Tax=Proteinivorax hydrogeniformans TaxID=1826727 RepID=A0AAU8HV88_9FIRM
MEKIEKGFKYINGNTKAVLVIHGFTGSPTEVHPLARFLADQGFDVFGPCLPGHGTTVEDMIQYTDKDWIDAVDKVLADMIANYQKCYVVGFSMGGAIALHLTAKYQQDISALATISAPIYIPKATYFANLIKHFKKSIPKPPKPDYGVPIFSYTETPVQSLPFIVNIIKQAKKDIPKISIPIFVSQGLKDSTVYPKSAGYIFSNVSSTEKKIRYYCHASHMLPVEKKYRDKLFNEMNNFLQAY